MKFERCFNLSIFLQGKVKPVTERTAGTDLLEPTPNFDCHISRSIQNLPANTPHGQVFDYGQVPLSSSVLLTSQCSRQITVNDSSVTWGEGCDEEKGSHLHPHGHDITFHAQ